MHSGANISTLKISNRTQITNPKGKTMADIMASHRAAKMGRAASTPALIAQLFAWHGRWLQHRRMKTLDPHLRRDLGLTEPSAARAAVRPGWDIGLPGLR
jgi:hypothetical protein